MRTWRIKPAGRPAVVGLLAIAMVIASSVTNDARVRKTRPAKTAATQQEKSVKLRYYGGPKSPMYPESKALATQQDATQQDKRVKLRYYGGPKSPMYPE